MPTTILDGESYEQALHRRYAEESALDAQAMSQRHTPEPWKVLNHSWSDTSIIAPSFDHGICCLDINHATEETQEEDGVLMEANARRIVACVNWCKGNSTEGMQRAIDIGRPYAVERDSAIERELELTKQRNDLLAALEQFLDPEGNPPEDTGEWREVLRVIASVKGEHPQGCHRSHPHENMSAECEQKTIEARDTFKSAVGIVDCGECPSVLGCIGSCMKGGA